MPHDLLSRESTSFAPSRQAPSYLIPPDPVVTGIPLVDEGLACDLKDPQHEQLWRHYVDYECFLSPTQRGHLLMIYQERVDAAHGSYSHALDELRVDEMLKKGSGGSWLFDILLDVIGLAAVAGIVRGAKALVSTPAVAAGYTSDVATAQKEVAQLRTRRIEMVARQAVLSGRRSIPKPHDAHNEQASAAIGYLAILADQASFVFRGLRENGPADASDAELLVLVDGFDLRNGHLQSDYKKMLAEKLRHFESSEVGNLGVTWNDRKDVSHPLEPEQVDTKAFWVQLPTGPRLALYRRAHVETVEANHFDPGPYGLYPHVISDREATRRNDAALRASPFTFDRYIPDDLVDTALQMHEAKWGERPEPRVAGGAEWAGVAGGVR